MLKLKHLFLGILTLIAVDTFSQDCGTKITVDKFTKRKEAALIFDRQEPDKKKRLSLQIQTLDNEMNCFMMTFYIDTYTGKPDGIFKEGTNPDKVGKSFTFYFLFDNNESVRMDSKPYLEGVPQFAFCKSDYQNLITNLSSSKLTDLRIVTYTSDNTLTDWHVPTTKQTFFIEVFKCFSQTN